MMSKKNVETNILTDFCQTHHAMLEYVCTSCKDLMCRRCVEQHPVHNTLFSGSNYSILHILRYAKEKIQPEYGKVASEVESQLTKLKGQSGGALKKICEMMNSLKPLYEKIKETETIMANLLDEVATMMMKIEFLVNLDAEQEKIERERKILESSISIHSISKLIQNCNIAHDIFSTPKPTILDLAWLNESYELFSKWGKKNFPKFQEQFSELKVSLSLLLKSLKTTPASKQQFPTLKSIPNSAALTHELSLKNAINNIEFDEASSHLSQMRKSMTIPKLLGVCAGLERGFTTLLAYSHQRYYVNSEEEFLRYLYELQIKEEKEKHTSTVSQLKTLNLPSIVEYRTIANILRESTIKAQNLRINNFLKLPKKQYSFSQLMLDNYLNYMEFQGNFTAKLIKNKKDWAETMVTRDSVMKVAHYANQIPQLEPEVDVMTNKISIPRKHMQIIRLKSYGDGQNWEGFQKYIVKEKPKLPPDLFAEICIVNKNHDLANEYIQKVSRFDHKVDMYLENESYIEAAEAAVQSKDPALIQELKSRVIYDMDPYIKDAMKKFNIK